MVSHDSSHKMSSMNAAWSKHSYTLRMIFLGCAVWDFLSDYYSQQHLHIMQAYCLNLRRVASFVAATFIMGGELAPVTLQVAETIPTLHNDEDGQFIIHSFAYGAEWGSIDPPVTFKSPTTSQISMNTKWTHKLGRRYRRADT